MYEFQIHNKKYNTFPLIAHNPSSEVAQYPIWGKLQEIKNKKNYCEMPQDLTIVTWNNLQNKGILEQQLENLNISYVCLGKGLEWTSNRLKPKLLIEEIKNIKTTYLLALDCFDVLITDHLIDIINRFKQKNTKLLFNATCHVWPDVSEHRAIESKICNNGPFQFFNSGCFIGETNYINWFLNQIVFDDLKHDYSDQYLLRQLYHKYYPEVQIDWDCQIFQIIFDRIGQYLDVKFRCKTFL